MLSATAATNLLQKHLKVLLRQWHETTEAEVKSTLELAFVLMLNRALAQLLEEEKSYENPSVEIEFSDFTSFVKNVSSKGNLSPLQAELCSAMQDSNHWINSWYKAWKLLAYNAQNARANIPAMIVKESHGQLLLDLDGWFEQFNGLVESLRIQNEYC